MTKDFSSFWDSGDNADLQFDDNDQRHSSEGSNDETSDVEASDGQKADTDGDGESDAVRDDGNANAGWAEAMAKILIKRTTERKNSILVKNKELDKIKERERQEQLQRKKQVNPIMNESVLYTVKNNKTVKTVT